MWLSSFWRSRNRFSLDELRYLADQLTKIQVVNEVNKAFVIESLRSIAELITYGDQHDAAFFEFFMEKQILGEFVRILKISRTSFVSVQLLQTMSIMIQNLKSEHSICKLGARASSDYMFSNENTDTLITYPFDFNNEELLSYYISFLRAISGKLDKNTISLLVKNQKDEVFAFPLYVEAIRFAFHEEGMIRTAVRALTLNIYHVGDEAVNRYVASAPHSDYFLNLVKFFQEQCINLNGLVARASMNLLSESIPSVLSAVDEIEDNLYYFSDVISAGIPDVGRLITDYILKLLIFPLILPSLGMAEIDGKGLSAATSLYLLCCILRIVKIKDLSNAVAAALLCHTENLVVPMPEAKVNGNVANHGSGHESEEVDKDFTRLQDSHPNISCSAQSQSDNNVSQHHSTGSSVYREALLNYITSGDDVLVSGSLSVLATLLQTKELDESMVDALGILPQRKQHKKLLLQALVGEGSGEEQLFSSETNATKDSFSSELENYLAKLKDQYGFLCTKTEVGLSPRLSRFQVLDALVSLFGRSNISAETLWDGGWLLRQLLPYSEAEFNSRHLKLLKDSFRKCARHILKEARGSWTDLLITVLCDEWRKCKRAIEASSPRKDPNSILLPPQSPFSEDRMASESSSIAGARMCEMVKVFVLLHQLHFFSLGRTLLDQPPVHPPIDVPDKSRAKIAGLDTSGPKPSTELFLVDAVPCRIAFERGKERQFSFLAISVGTSGWLILAEELPQKPQHGVVRVSAPLAGCNPRIDEKHLRWLHLRIRPSSFLFTDAAKHAVHGKVKTKALVDGRWTLAFRDEESCRTALSMTLQEIQLQSSEVERRLQPLLDLETTVDSPRPTKLQEAASSRTPFNTV